MPEWHEKAGERMQESVPPKRNVSTQSSLELNTPQAPIDAQRKNTAWKALKTAGLVSGMVMGPAIGTGIVGYAFYPEKYHELKDRLVAAMQSPSAEPKAAPAEPPAKTDPQPAEKNGIIKLPQTPAELLEQLKTENLLAKPEDFQRKQMNMNGLMLVEEQKADGTKAIVWKKVEDKKSDVQNVVIATKIENPNNAKFMSYMYYHPIVAVEDEKDPRIKYHLFGCSPQEDRRKRGVAIVLKQKGRNGRDSLLGNVDFILPYCEKKTD